ncbi:MAG: PP2C family protein-serine/threonine phosphatase [Lachnospiraceae bacterium]|nr:PP2C family protein-serine/threonine phosphatase [Lachnospiraceae bacterium]
MDAKLQKKRSLVTIFIIMFAIFGALTVIMNLVYTYVVQSRVYHQQCADRLTSINNYMKVLIDRDGDDFYDLRMYFEDHKDEILIPLDYAGDPEIKGREFYRHFEEKHPGMVYGEDIQFNELEDDLKLLYAEYTYEYWLTIFEDIRDSFGLEYTFFIYPTEIPKMCYMIDIFRDEKVVDGKSYISLGIEVEEDPQKHKRMWEAWNTGKPSSGFDVFNNEHGYTYTYYVPIIKDGEQIGLACAGISVEQVTSSIINTVVSQLAGSFIVLIIGLIIISRFIRKGFLVRLVRLERSVAQYTELKDDKISEEIRKNETGNDEIRSLSDQFADMIVELRDYMVNLQHVTAEKERIGAELNVATQIQADMLPRVFPAFPTRDEFDLYATMNPAKEVGGDFYDFFMVDDDHIALVMADVSGKGVPAALFMVIAKTLIKTKTQQGGLPGDILSEVNDTLCEGNDAELFVTVWLAIIEISTGKGWAANAGHEHPAIRRKDGDFELSIYKHSPAVATMEGIPFRQHEFELYPGDSLYVYTDGVAEATDANNELYGTDRMLNVLNRTKDEKPEEVLRAVRKDIDEFVGEAPQFDDITMLMFNYFGKVEE